MADKELLSTDDVVEMWLEAAESFKIDFREQLGSSEDEIVGKLGTALIEVGEIILSKLSASEKTMIVTNEIVVKLLLFSVVVVVFHFYIKWVIKKAIRNELTQSYLSRLQEKS